MQKERIEAECYFLIDFELLIRDVPQMEAFAVLLETDYCLSTLI